MGDDTLVPFTHNDYEIVSREVPYQGIFRMVRYTLRFRLFNGDWSNSVTRELMERKSAAAVLPYDPALDRVLLIEQFRPGAFANPQSPWLLEIVAGVLGQDEPPTEVVKREAMEEAGCEILDLYPISEYFVSPGGCNEFISIFCGRFDATQPAGFFGLEEEDEDIRAFILSFDEAYEMLQKGVIKTSPAIVSLQWLKLNRDWIRLLWQKK